MDGLTPRDDGFGRARARSPRRVSLFWRVVPWLVAGLAAGGLAALWLAPDALRALGRKPPAAAPAPPPPADPAMAALAERIAALEAERLQGPPETPPAKVAQPPDDRLASLEAETRRLAEVSADLDRRLSALAAELDAGGATSGALATATGQVRDLFILAATRRQLERGAPLGALEPALARAFEAREPSAVAALAAWSRQPVAPRQLGERLGQPVVDPSGPAEGGGFWSRLFGGLSGLVELRRHGSPDPRSIERARAALERDDLASAIALVENSGEGEWRAEWIADARRLLAARDGLERLELIAIAELPPAPPPAG